MNEEIIQVGTPCPVEAKEWDYDERDPKQHFFEKDYFRVGFFKGEGLIGFHCTKCGLTVKYKK